MLASLLPGSLVSVMALLSSLNATAAVTPIFARADLVNAKGENVGAVKLSETNEGVLVEIVAKGLKPGEHGIHFHEKGKCEGADGFKSAGGHFAMPGTEHGLSNPKGPHLGDLPNLKVSYDGTVATHFVASHVSLKSGKNSLLKEGGTALVIHAGADDQKTSPSGNSGDRVLCGVITPLK